MTHRQKDFIVSVPLCPLYSAPSPQSELADEVLWGWPLTLLDASVSFCAPDDAELTEQILLHTHAAPVDAQEADFLFCTRAQNLAACIEAAKCGTLADPHTGATILVRVPQEESVRVRLSGPGVDGALETEVPRDVLAAIRTRNAQAYEYPQGVDFFFLLPGDAILAIPRLVRMEEV